VPAAHLHTQTSRELRTEGFLTRVAAAAISGFVVIGLVTTLALATAARRREFALLRLAGATRRQVLRSLRLESAIVLGTGLVTGALVAGVALVAFAAAITGPPLPSVPVFPAALVLLLVAGPGMAAALLTARSLLPRRTEPGVPSPERGPRR
jgi:putative ABC transport system permease protein